MAPDIDWIIPIISAIARLAMFQAAAVNTPLHTSPLGIKGVETEGVTCDFCHKIWNVLVDSKTGLPFPDKPGVLSYEFRRPFKGHQFFAGPLDDIAPGEDVYSKLQKDSLFVRHAILAFSKIRLYTIPSENGCAVLTVAKKTAKPARIAICRIRGLNFLPTSRREGLSETLKL